jgi:hypothetical protein
MIFVIIPQRLLQFITQKFIEKINDMFPKVLLDIINEYLVDIIYLNYDIYYESKHRFDKLSFNIIVINYWNITFKFSGQICFENFEFRYNCIINDSNGKIEMKYRTNPKKIQMEGTKFNNSGLTFIEDIDLYNNNNDEDEYVSDYLHFINFVIFQKYKINEIIDSIDDRQLIYNEKSDKTYTCEDEYKFIIRKVTNEYHLLISSKLLLFFEGIIKQFLRTYYNAYSFTFIRNKDAYENMHCFTFFRNEDDYVSIKTELCLM